MEAIASNQSTSPAPGGSLVETVSRLCVEFSAVQKELEDARSENHRLRTELEKWHSRWETLPSVDTSSLRRRVAYFCHPDRGGNTDLMSAINVVFDFISALEYPGRVLRGPPQQGAVQ
jgi:hypothetical protein